jgi:hypothetical protein
MVIEVRRDQELLVGDLLPAEHLDWDAEAKAEVASGVDQGSVPGLIFHQMLESSGNDRHENRHNRHDGYMMVNIGKHHIVKRHQTVLDLSVQIKRVNGPFEP